MCKFKKKTLSLFSMKGIYLCDKKLKVNCFRKCRFLILEKYTLITLHIYFFVRVALFLLWIAESSLLSSKSGAIQVNLSKHIKAVCMYIYVVELNSDSPFHFIPHIALHRFGATFGRRARNSLSSAFLKIANSTLIYKPIFFINK